MNSRISTNSIAFIGLCNEFCMAVENARETSRPAFIDHMLRLLPRLYISASDLRTESAEEVDPYIDNILEEEYYDAVRRNMESVFGEDDMYLEVFEEDMKYSDTPVAASIAEGLADIFQVLYNFINTAREATDETIATAIVAVHDDFLSFWSATLCNVLRALNHLKMNS